MTDLDDVNPRRTGGIGGMGIRILLALVVVVAAAGVYLATRSDTSTPHAASTPTPSAAATDTSGSSPTPGPATAGRTATPAPSTSASPHPSGSSSPHPTANPTPASVSGGYPPPGLVLAVRDQPITGNPPGVSFTIHVTDNDGQVTSLTVNYGDGYTATVVQSGSTSCPSRTGHGPPPGYRAQPVDRTYQQSHRYNQGGTYTAVISVSTGRPCMGTPAESASRTFTVTVPDFTPNPTDSPSPSASPTPSPRPSSSASPSPSPSRTA